jgi:PAS domain S-box-containing protein
LKKSEDVAKLDFKLRDLFPCGAFIVDLKKMEVIHSNERAKKIGAKVGSRCFDIWRDCGKRCSWCPPINKWKEMVQQSKIIKNNDRSYELYWVKADKDLSFHLFFDITDKVNSDSKLHTELMINSSINNILKKIIGKGLKIREVSDLILNFTRFITTSSEGFILLARNSNEKMDPISWTGIFDEVFRSGQAITKISIIGKTDNEKISETILERNEVFLCNSPVKTMIDTGSSSTLKIFKNQLGIPIFQEEKIKGMIYLTDSDSGYTNNYRKIVEEFLHLLAILLKERDIQYRLMETTNRYRSLFNNAIDMIHIVDDKGKIIDANKKELERMGYSRDEYIGKRLLDFIHPEYKKKTQTALNKVLSGEYIKGHTTTLVAKDGSCIIVEVNATPKWKEGKVVEAAGIFRDITDQVKSHEEILKYQDFQKTLMDAIPIPIFYKDKEGRYLGVNRSFESFFGARREDIIGKTVYDINPPELARTYEKKDLELFENGGIQQYRYQVKNTEGEIRDVLFNKAAFYDKEGSVQGLIGTVLDFTEKIRAEEQIKSANAFLDIVIEMSPFSMWVSDEKGTVIRTNRSLEKTINISKEKIAGKYNVFNDINLKNQGVMDKVKAVFEKHEPARFEIFWKSSNVKEVDFSSGRDMYIDVSMFPIDDFNGNLVNVVCQWVDITKKIQTENHLKGEKENAEFYLDLLNHDLGNIHQGIHSSLLLMEQYLPQDQKELARILELAKESLFKSISLTNEVKIFSKMRSQRVELDYVNLKVAIEKGIDDVKKSFPEKEIEFDLHLFDQWILAESIIGQAFYNLFDNAIKLQGLKPWIGVEMVLLQEGIAISIMDKGPGIIDSRKKLLFSKKRNIDNGLRTGIGLLIVKELVERYGGRIEVGDRIMNDFSSGAKFLIEFKKSKNSGSFIEKGSRIFDDTMPKRQQ